jgi:hypothetical protein
MKGLKKLAMAAAMGLAGSGAAHAVVLGEPGEGLLVPYVIYDTARQLNTLVGITTAAEIGQAFNTRGAFAILPYPTAVNATVNAPPGPSYTALHWFFFDDRSVHLLDNDFSVTGDDWHGLDWGAIVQAQPAAVQAVLDGQLGYLVIADERARDGATPSDVALYGDAAVIAGNWQSAAFVPVIPLADDTDLIVGGPHTLPLGSDDIIWGPGGIPAAVSPVTAGTPRDDDGTVGTVVRIDLRYFLDPALNGTTNLVFWNDANEATYAALPIEVFDTEENNGSFQLDISSEVNEVDASTLAWTTHASAEGHVNSGFVRVDLPHTIGAGVFGGPETAFVAFSLIGFGTAGNAVQVQTALAHERGSL